MDFGDLPDVNQVRYSIRSLVQAAEVNTQANSHHWAYETVDDAVELGFITKSLGGCLYITDKGRRFAELLRTFSALMKTDAL